MSSFLYGLGRSSYRHRVRVLLAWLAALVVLGVSSVAVSKGFDENFSLPGTESQTALDSLNRTFPQAGGTTAQVVVVCRSKGCLYIVCEGFKEEVPVYWL